MEEKLRIPKRDPDDRGMNACVIKINRKAHALVNELCSLTNRSQQDVASRLIEWAYERVEIIEDGDQE